MSGDIFGIDVGYKVIILYCFVFYLIMYNEIEVRGIVEVMEGDIERVKVKGKIIWLVVRIEKGNVVVEFVEILKESLFVVESYENVVVIKIDFFGEFFIKGVGVGFKEIVSGVISDVIKVVFRLV